MKKVSILTTDQDGTLKPLEEVVFSKDGTKTKLETKFDNSTFNGIITLNDTGDASRLAITSPDGKLRISSHGIMFGGTAITWKRV